MEFSCQKRLTVAVPAELRSEATGCQRARPSACPGLPSSSLCLICMLRLQQRGRQPALTDVHVSYRFEGVSFAVTVTGVGLYRSRPLLLRRFSSPPRKTEKQMHQLCWKAPNYLLEHSIVPRTFGRLEDGKSPVC